MSSPDKPTGNRVPVRLIFSLMVVVMGAVLSAFLAYAGVSSGFKWPGLIKTIVSFVLLAVCLAYGFMRGDNDLKTLRALPPGDKQVGFGHLALIMLFIFALTALALWILVGPPQSPVPGPLG